MNFALRLIQLLLRHRLIAGLLILVSIVASIHAARSIEVRFQYRDFYEYEGNPRLPLLTRYTEEFGDPGSFVILLVESQDVFSRETLQYIDSITRQLEASNDFLQVRSLTNAQAIRAAGDDVESGPVFQRLPESAQDVEHMRAIALGSALLVRRVVSPDSTATAILAEMRTPGAFATVAQQRTAIAAVEGAMQRTPSPAGVRAQVTGAPLVEAEVTSALVNDQLVLTPLLLLIMTLALGLTFRTLQGVLLPLASVGVSLVWTAGIFSLLGRHVDIVASVIPTTLLVYGVVDPIFFYTRYLDKLPFSRTREEAIVSAMRELLLPCFLTSLATAVGFAAFTTARLPSIKYFGIVVGMGVLFAFLTTVTVLPILLVSVARTQHHGPKPWISGATDTLMTWIWHLAKTKPELIVAVALSTLIVGGGAALLVRSNSEYVGSLPKGRVQDSVRLLEQRLSGVVRTAIYLEGEPDSMKRPEVLEAVQAVDRLAERQQLVTSSISLADLVGDTNQAFMGGDKQEHHVPDSAPLISQYLALVDPGDLSDFVNSDYSRSHIQILVSDRGSQALWGLLEVLQRDIDSRFPELGIKATLTGHGLVVYHDWDRVVEEVLWGFLFAFSMIILIQLVIFRSLRVALLSIVPNLVPVCACFLVMRVLGLPLRIDSSLVLCISVGGLFNTTIHLIARILQQVRGGLHEPDLVVSRALAAVGPPSLYTAVILSAGFAVLGFSRFPGLRMLGLLCMVTLLTGFAADATITTTFFRYFFGWKGVRSRARAQGLKTPAEPRRIANEEALP